MKLENGKYYKNLDTGAIFLYNEYGKAYYYLGCSNQNNNLHTFKRNNGGFQDNSDNILANENEIAWLEYCNKIDKFVPEIEYLLQKAREDYPEGTKFITHYGVIQTSRGVDFFQSKGDIHASTPKNEWSLTGDHCSNPAVYYNGVWAEKVEEEFVLPEKWCVKVTDENKKIINKWKQVKNPNSETAGAFDNKYVTYDGWNDDIPDDCKEITFEQFEKYVLNSKENMEKKIIGYKLIKPEYEQAAIEICKQNGSKDIDDLRNDPKDGCSILIFSKAEKWLKQAGVLDLWFEPVYEEEKPNITINGHKAEFFDDYVKFGCAEIAVDHFKQIWDVMTVNHINSNRKVDKVTIGKGEFNAEQIKQIVEYYKNK